jgi:cell division protease FtsH
LKPGFIRQPITIKNLVKGIEQSDFDTLYFNPDMRTVVATDKDTDIQFTATISPLLTEKLVDVSLQHNVDTVFLNPPSNDLATIISFIPNLFFAIIAFSFVRSLSMMSNMMGEDGGNANIGRFMSFGKKNLNMDKNTSVKFSDWAGSQEVLEECIEFVSYLNKTADYEAMGVKIPRGILLDGPPGTGKTLLAKAIANESASAFFSASGSEFIEMFVGVGAMRVRKLFEEARKSAPSIVFIDEIDAIGKQRGRGGMMSGNDEAEQTLNQLLTEMDGFQANTNITVIAATNRADILDSALLRPGRFDRIIRIPLPDLASREAILNLYLKNKMLEKGINVGALAKLTSGFSGAQLSNLVNEAAILAARSGDLVIRQRFLDDALEKLLIGIKKRTDTRDDTTKRRIAIHEIGHAFVVQQFPDYFDLQKISIQPTYSGAGGYTIFTEKESIAEYGLYTRDFLLKRLMVAMGGKAAEAVYYGNNFISVGASMDLKQATQLARDMVEKYRHGDSLRSFSKENDYGTTYSDMIYTISDTDVLDLVNQAYEAAVELITENKMKTDAAVDVLINSVIMDSVQFTDILDNCDRTCVM